MKKPDFLIIKNRWRADKIRDKLQKHYWRLIISGIVVVCCLPQVTGLWFYIGILVAIAAALTIAILTYLKVQLARWYRENPAK